MPLTRLSRFDFGIFLISFAVLLLELLLTRIFSVTLYYHLSFMVVSLAMLGLGASGLLINLLQKRLARGNVEGVLSFAAILFATSASRGGRRFPTADLPGPDQGKLAALWLDLCSLRGALPRGLTGGRS
ncbi:MAG: hypothetical protein ACREBC_04640, partial [Pyrinomonadaceae bacterium]